MKFNKRLFGILGAFLIVLGCITQYSVFVNAADGASVTYTAISCAGGPCTVTYTGISSLGASSVKFTIPGLIENVDPTTKVDKTATINVTFPQNHGLNDKYYSTRVIIDNVTVASLDNNIKQDADVINSFTVAPPTKTSYYVGDTIDLSGAKITNVSCVAGTGHPEMNVTNAMINSSDLYCSAVGTKTITVSYGINRTATFNVTVAAKPLNQLNPPTCYPDEGTYHREKTIRLHNNPTDSGATIYYTKNGTTPRPGYSGTTRYTGSFDIRRDTTVKAISVKDGYADSAVAEFDFDIDLDDDDDDDDSYADIENDDWYDVAYDVLALRNNETYTVVMSKDNSAVPYDVLQNIMGRDINLLLDFGSFEWHINGKDVTSIPSSQIYYNMYVRSIYDNDISSLSGSDEVIQLELDHNGNFPGKFNLKLYAGNGYANNILYLNYYNDRTYKLEQTAYATVDAYGYVTFPFNHASRYVITKRNIAGAAANTQPAPAQPSSSSSSKATGYTPPISWVYNPKPSSPAASSSSSEQSSAVTSSQASSSSSKITPVDLPVQPATPKQESKPFNDYLGIVLIAAGSFLCGMTIFVAVKGLKK